ncbi:MAG: hypothetical protein JNL14_05575 [Devosia sp.]|jgi:hypothetical protein|uniref:hypothetical protein n=1 Tax=Devosia sp. TaxID=1871048 RepID=UPI001A464726|nr:hypothetical protein [Devosia sp.]MBL8597189.1 hypothetical protein [Devosia sp.]
MYVLHMEHPVPDYEAWKQRGFDPDPLGRRQMGVTRYRIGRKAGDPNHVMIELQFETTDAASRMAAALQQMWVGAQARGLIGVPQLTQFEIVEDAVL